MSSHVKSINNSFRTNLKEAIKTFLTLAGLIFFLILSFYILSIVFPENVIMEPGAFVFGYMMAVPFMFTLSLYPFGKK